jgi:glycosyltransferase involved in cell wall biosynthesis
MKAPFFTVMIDTYNHGRYIEEAVASVLAQEFPVEEREILIVDDGSSDDTEALLRKFGSAIRYFRKPNGGQPSAFNFGFERARGKVIALLDADDVWLPAKLSRIYEGLQGHPEAGMVYHRVHLWDASADISEDGYFIPVSGHVAGNRRLLLQYPMVDTSCLAFRREALEELLPVPEALRFQADAYLTALVIFVAPVLAVNEFLEKYRLHAANLFQVSAGPGARQQIERRISMRQVLLGAVQEWLQKHGKNNAYLKLRSIGASLMSSESAPECRSS